MDSLAVYDSAQQALKRDLDKAQAEKVAVIAQNEAREASFAAENTQLKTALHASRTLRVERVIAEEPELQTYIANYDSLLVSYEERIGAMKLEAEMVAEANGRIESNLKKMVEAEQNENAYLRSENDKQHQQIAKLEKQVKRRTWLAGFFAALNLIPRGG